MSRQIVFALVLFAATADSQNSLPVVFAGDSSRNTYIGMFRHNGIAYGSLNDLAAVLGIKTFHNIDARKLELHTEQFSVKVTAENSFVVITDSKRSACSSKQG